MEVAYKSYDPDEFFGIENLEAWITLVHVCQRWRGLVFASPRRLNLRLVCTRGKPVREMLDIWPTLPIVVDYQDIGRHQQPDVDGLIATLEHRNRVCQISLQDLRPSLFLIFTEMMQESFLELTHLFLGAGNESPMPHPDSFLGGSAPHLRSLTLQRIPFPELPTLLLSTKDLVELRLWNILHSGSISPESMATCLSSLTRLEILELRFLRLHWNHNTSSRHLSSSTCIDLPALTQFHFEGVNEYIALMAQINAPLLRHIWITFFDQALFDLDISQFTQFIGRLKVLKTPYQSVVAFDDHCPDPQFLLYEDPAKGTTLEFTVSCASLERKLPFLTALFGSSSSPFQLSSSEHLKIFAIYTPRVDWHGDTEDIPWLEMLQPFTAVKGLRMNTEPAIHLGRTLQDLAGERAAEVLPSLQDIFISEHRLPGAAREAMRPFVAARQLSGHPVTIHRWE